MIKSGILAPLFMVIELTWGRLVDWWLCLMVEGGCQRSLVAVDGSWQNGRNTAPHTAHRRWKQSIGGTVGCLGPFWWMLVVVGALVVAFGGGQWPDKWPESIGKPGRDARTARGMNSTSWSGRRFGSGFWGHFGLILNGAWTRVCRIHCKVLIRVKIEEFTHVFVAQKWLKISLWKQLIWVEFVNVDWLFALFVYKFFNSIQ